MRSEKMAEKKSSAQEKNDVERCEAHSTLPIYDDRDVPKCTLGAGHSGPHLMVPREDA